MSCYIIKSRMNGLVLDVKEEYKYPGAPVITWKEHGKINQLWYDHPETGTIRSKLTDFCLDLDNEMLVCRPYEEEAHTQKWERNGAFIVSRTNSKKVLDIYGKKKSAGAKVGAYEFHGKENQQWEFIMVPTSPVQKSPSLSSQASQEASAGLYPTDELRDMDGEISSRREFWIVSEFSQRVIDIRRDNTAADAKVILWEQKPNAQAKNQLWYLDDEGFIRSSLNNFVFMSEEKGKPLRMVPYQKNPRSQWMIDENRVFNRTGECLEVKGTRKEDSTAELICGKYKGSATQHWTIQYLS